MSATLASTSSDAPMITPTEPLSQITEEVVRELGVARALRFLAQYRTGTGGYTAERHNWLPDGPLGQLVEEARRIDRERGARPRA